MDHGGEFCRKMETIIRTNFSMALVPLQEAVCIYTRSVLPLNVLHLCFFYIYIYNLFASAVAGKDFEGDKEGYSSAEWQERVEKWKIRQEKRGLVTKDDGGNDQGDGDDDFL